MALWGNDDYVTRIAAGTVSLDYDTKVITGANGTQFGVTGYAKEGDVLRIGFKGSNGTYFGDATIASIESATKCTIASTEGLSGAGIAGTSFWVSELPVYTTTNPIFSENTGYNKLPPSFSTVVKTNALGQTGVGKSVIGMNGTGQVADELAWHDEGSEYPDTLLNNGGNTLKLRSLNIAYVTARFTVASGTNIIPVGFEDLPGIGTAPVGTPQISNYQEGGFFYGISGVAATTITIHDTLDAGITAGDKLKFNSERISMLTGNVSAGINTGDTLEWQRLTGGHDRYVYGVGDANVEATEGGEYQNSAGWVGVTTYHDCDGKLRVKSEILVAMSGIQTGPAGAGSTSGKGYPPV